MKKYFLLIRNLNKKRLFFRLIEKFGLLKRLGLKKIKMTLNNKKIIIPIIQGIGYENLFMEEPWMCRIIEKVNKIKNGAFIDVGANLGQTLIKYKSYDFDQLYYGFEPNPTCFRYINELIKANGFANCEIFPVGLSNKYDVVTLFSINYSDSSASLIEGFRDPTYYSSKMKVPVYKGDNLMKKLGLKAISFIKIDVEGSELEVIQGLNDTIEEFKPFITCEILPIYDETKKSGIFRKERQIKLLAILKNSRYKLFRISPTEQLIPLDSIETHSDLSLTNYIFIPETETKKFLSLL